MIYSRFLILATFCLLFVATTSCTHAAAKESSPSQNIQAGTFLYEEHCTKCHRTLTNTTKPQRPINRLRSAISQFPAMHDLDFLDDKQLSDITAALATIPL